MVTRRADIVRRLRWLYFSTALPIAEATMDTDPQPRTDRGRGGSELLHHGLPVHLTGSAGASSSLV